MLYAVLKHIRNFFSTGTHINGAFVIENGTIDGFTAGEGQFFLIEGSVFNDGVHKFGDADLATEEFTGCVTLLAIPSDFLKLVEEIEEYCSKSRGESNFVSESFGGYSYTKATNASGNIAGWKDVFASRLNSWRCV